MTASPGGPRTVSTRRNREHARPIFSSLSQNLASTTNVISTGMRKRNPVTMWVRTRASMMCTSGFYAGLQPFPGTRCLYPWNREETHVSPVKRLLTCLVPCCLLALPAAAGPTPTLHEWISVAAADVPSIAPDGKTLAFLSTT